MSLSSAAAADYEDSVNNRDFQLHVPATAEGRKNIPVVIALHGGGGHAAQFREQTGLDAIADANGFMVVYPEGTKSIIGNFRTWNAGPCCGKAAKQNVDDVAFIAALIDVLVQKYGADRTRVYATGHSNGAMMSWRLACELSDRIAAIAPNAGQRILEDCHPARAVPVLHIHGTADPCALYNGGAQCGGCFSEALGLRLPGDKWACPPVKDVVAAQAKMNGCGAETETVFTKGAVTCTRYKGCPAQGVVELCSIQDAGHRWPGSADIGPASCHDNPAAKKCQRYATIVGPGSADIDAGALMWDFFKQFHLPAKESR